MKKIFVILCFVIIAMPVFAVTPPKSSKIPEYECDLLDSYDVCVEKTAKKYVNDTVLKNKFKGIYDDITANYGIGSAIHQIELRRNACIHYLVKKYSHKVIPDEHIESLEKETQSIVNRLAEAKYIKEVKTEKVFVPIHYPSVLDFDYQPYEMTPQRIHYGYNAVGDYVPMSVGNQRIHYGYNAYGDYVPMSIGD